MQTLESHKAFPIIAWIVVFGFAGFVYTLTLNLDHQVGLLSEQTMQTQAALVNQQ